MNPRGIAFVTVGAIGLVVQLMVLTGLTLGAHWSVAPATALAVEAALLTNFLWHSNWTWRDRMEGWDGCLTRLLRFHLATGGISIAGNVILTTILTIGLGMNVLVANVIAVALLSTLNYLVADRWVFARRGAISAVLVLMLSPARAHAAELKPATVKAWDRHIAALEASLAAHENDPALKKPEGRVIDVAGGSIHEWRGSTFVRGVTVSQVVDALTNPGTPPPQEDVIASRVIERHGDSSRVYLKLRRQAIVTVVYDTEHSVSFDRRSSSFATSRSIATRIAETDGNDRGFLWRLNSYWRYRQVGGGVQVDVLSVSLGRGIPTLVKPVAGPAITRIARESLSRTLAAVQRFCEALAIPRGARQAA